MYKELQLKINNNNKLQFFLNLESHLKYWETKKFIRVAR